MCYLSLILANVGHLNSLLAEFPFIPEVVRIEIALDEVYRSLDIFVEHELVLD